MNKIEEKIKKIIRSYSINEISEITAIWEIKRLMAISFVFGCVFGLVMLSILTIGKL